ncbi:MAG: two-component regulator propeller domain-containing protein [Flammeovirgaceae bacterium]
MKYLLSTLLSCTLLSTLSWGQTNLKGERFTIQHGLSQNHVLSILQDHSGFIWMGTQDGLNKFDAYQFRHYKEVAEDSNQLNNDYILALHQTKDQKIWIGTLGGGLNCYDPVQDKVSRINLGLQDVEISAITEDAEGNLWIGSRNQGLIYFNPTDRAYHAYPLGVAIYAICLTESGDLWLGTEDGFQVFDPKGQTIKRSEVPQSKLAALVNSIYEDRAGRIWIASSKGLYFWDKDTEAIKSFPTAFTVADVRLVFEDQQQNLWVGSYEDGLMKLSKNRKAQRYFRKAQYDGSLPDNSIHTIYEDRAGILWIGTNSGVLAYNPTAQKFQSMRHQPNDKNSISHNSVRSFYEDDQQQLWLITQGGGLNKVNRKTGEVTRYLHNPNNPNTVVNNQLRAMLVDHQGLVWVGSTSKGISVLNPKTNRFTHYRHNPNDPTSLPNDNIWAIYQTRDQVIWVGTYGGGLAYFDPVKKSFFRYTHDPENENTIGSNQVLRILEDQQGDLWLGVSGSGLDRFDRKTKQFEHFKSDPLKEGFLSNKYVLSIHEDRKGNIWAGTAAGLNKLDRKTKTFQRYKEANGFPNGMIYGILEDKDGFLWLSTNLGIIKFNPESEEVLAFTEADGLQSNEFNFGAYYQNKAGELFFGGINGYNVFKPQDITKNTVVPPILMTDFKLFNKAVPIHPKSYLKQHINLTEEITLSHKESVIFFEFAALNYTQAHKNEYAYKLEGFDEYWNYIGTRRNATYTNLPPGSYTFRVKGSNNDQVWNDEGVSIKLNITPPLWKELWVQVLAVLFVIGLAYFIYRSKISGIKSQGQELERLVNERTKEILEKNQAIFQQKQEIEAAYQNVHVLNQIGYQITATFSVEMILETSYDLVNQVLDASCFGIGLYNEEHNSLEFPIFIERGKRLGYNYDLVDAENRLSAWCFIHQKPILINDVEVEYTNYLPKKLVPVVGDLPLSVIYVPLTLPNKKIGVITIQSFKKNAYNDFHLKLIEGLALNIATAVDNANAYNYIEAQSEVLKKANQSINSSMRYALRIQQAMLPQPQVIQSIVPEHFIFYKARDIVGGDFYWFAQTDNKRFIAAVDCTGHGVPGGFMSMIGNQLLNEIVFRRHIYEVDEILRTLDLGIKKTLQQDQTASRDGMDLSICMIDDEHKIISFAGANNPLFYVSNHEGHLVKGAKAGIGGFSTKKEKKFEKHQLPLDKSATYFLYTDGFQDQFGGKEGRKYLGKPFREFLLTHHHKPMNEINQLLEEELQNWKGPNQKQIDDILVIGFRV